MITTALLAEGTSDRALLPVLRWLLARATSDSVHIEWIDLARASVRSSKLEDKVSAARLVYPCQLLFVHRDADNQPHEWRSQEIYSALGRTQIHVAVVPVRTMEAWLLFDEPMIRAAAGRPSGKEDLALPSLATVESVNDPKSRLEQALRTAHGGSGRRAARFHPPTAIHRLANLIEDWSPLRQVSAFQRLEQDTRDALAKLGAQVLG